jgi:hypothetical protein
MTPREPLRFAPVTPGDDTRVVILGVANEHGLTMAQMVGPSTRQRYVLPRQKAMAEVCRLRPDLSLQQIGKFFSRRHHTTVLHGIRQHQARMAWAEFVIWAGNPDEQQDLFARAA